MGRNADGSVSLPRDFRQEDINDEIFTGDRLQEQFDDAKGVAEENLDTHGRNKMMSDFDVNGFDVVNATTMETTDLDAMTVDAMTVDAMTVDAMTVTATTVNAETVTATDVNAETVTATTEVSTAKVDTPTIQNTSSVNSGRVRVADSLQVDSTADMKSTTYLRGTTYQQGRLEVTNTLDMNGYSIASAGTVTASRVTASSSVGGKIASTTDTVGSSFGSFSVTSLYEGSTKTFLSSVSYTRFVQGYIYIYLTSGTPAQVMSYVSNGTISVDQRAAAWGVNPQDNDGYAMPFGMYLQAGKSMTAYFNISGGNYQYARVYWQVVS